MKDIDRIIVIVALWNMVIYTPYFLIQVIAHHLNGIELHPMTILPWHFTGMFLNLLALVVTFRDLYRRHFSTPNSKVTWCLLILCTGGIGWIVYIFRHGLRPRPGPTHENAT